MELAPGETEKVEESKEKKKRKATARRRGEVEVVRKTREEINKMRVPGVPFLPPPPDPNTFKRGN